MFSLLLLCAIRCGAILGLCPRLRSKEFQSAVVRIFCIRTSSLMKAFVQDQIFGAVKTVSCATKFQRGSLPIGHILLLLDIKNHRHTPTGIDYARPACGERCCMRFLSNHVEEPSCFGEVKNQKQVFVDHKVLCMERDHLHDYAEYVNRWVLCKHKRSSTCFNYYNYVVPPLQSG